MKWKLDVFDNRVLIRTKDGQLVGDLAKDGKIASDLRWLIAAHNRKSERSAHQQRVDEFMRLAGRTLPQTPTIPDVDTRRLCGALILEESLETIEALGFLASVEINRNPDGVTQEMVSYLYEHGKPDLEKSVDGCIDTRYVCTYTLSSLGVSDRRPQELIDAANLAKFDPPHCPDCGKVLTWSGVIENGGGWVCTYHECKRTGFPKEIGPYTREDGKHIKPPYWKPPALDMELVRQSEGCPTCAQCGAIMVKHDPNETTTYAGWWVCFEHGSEHRIVSTSALNRGIVNQRIADTMVVKEPVQEFASRQWLELLVKEGKRLRATAIVDDDFPNIRSIFDSTLASADKYLQDGVFCADKETVSKFEKSMAFAEWWKSHPELHHNSQSEELAHAAFDAGRNAPVVGEVPWTIRGGVRPDPTTVHGNPGEPTPFEFAYMNHRGEFSNRRVIPRAVAYGITDYHPQPGWFLIAHDLDKNEIRTFSLNGINDTRRPAQIIPSESIKPYVQEISTCSEEYILIHHPGWYAIITQPWCKLGQPIHFVNNGRFIASGTITAIDRPENHDIKEFPGWWIIRYKPDQVVESSPARTTESQDMSMSPFPDQGSGG